MKNIFCRIVLIVKNHENTAISPKNRGKIENNLQKIKMILKIIFKHAMMSSR